MAKLVSTDEKDDTSVLQIVGFAIIAIGIAMLVLISWLAVCHQNDVNTGNGHPTDYSKVAAIGFLMIMLGISFIFPTMLAGYDGISTMRVAVYMIVCIFITLAIKDGWNSDKFVDISSNWMYIILTALGGKTVQSYTDSLKAKYALGGNTNSGTGGVGKAPLIPNSPAAAPGTGGSPINFDPNKISNTPPTAPPPHVK